jgi:hypothetical protein
MEQENAKAEVEQTTERLTIEIPTEIRGGGEWTCHVCTCRPGKCCDHTPIPDDP